ncbi:hypothetical protein [Nitrosopumilus sp.]|uniref:hypothetical protein n=1 Tax=Nitrosopumilus sp. TaxID=2024843 RepID=UPI003D1331F6
MHNSPEFRSLAVKQARKIITKLNESLEKYENLDKDTMLKYEQTPAYCIHELSGLSELLG